MKIFKLESCKHTEGDVLYRVHSIDRHNCKYVDQINALIPKAALLASNDVPSPDPVALTNYKLREELMLDYRTRWERAYFANMQRLAVLHGLRKPGPQH